MSSIGTKYVNSASTREKIRTIARTKPEQASFLEKSFGTTVQGLNSVAGSVNNASRSLDRHTRNVMQTLFSVELQSQEAIGTATSSIAGSISDLSDSLTDGIDSARVGISDQIRKTLKPVSSAVGQTLGNLTNVVADPLGAPFAIGRSVGNLIDKVNPGFANRLDASFKKLKVEELQNLPGQVMGSLRNLAALADAVLSFPFQLAADLYNGLLEIMQEISDLIDSVVSAVFNFFFDIIKNMLDSIFPISEILALLEEIGELADIVGSLSMLAGGFNLVTNFAMQISNYASQFSSIIQNPMQLALQYIPIPGEVDQILNMVRDPEQMLNSLIPSSLSNQLKQISNVPGLGFVGNMGYSVRGTLNTLSQGVFTQALSDLEEQAGILAPLFNQKTVNEPAMDTQQSSPPTVDGASTNPSIPTAQGVPVVKEPPPKVLQEKQNSGNVSIGNPNAANQPPVSNKKVNVTIPKDMQFSPNSSGSGVAINNPGAAKTPINPNVSVTIPNDFKFP